MLRPRWLFQGPTRPKSCQMGSDRVTVEDSLTPSYWTPWSNRPCRAWRCVWGQCPVDNKSGHKPDAMLLQNAVVAVLESAFE